MRGSREKTRFSCDSGLAPKIVRIQLKGLVGLPGFEPGTSALARRAEKRLPAPGQGSARRSVCAPTSWTDTAQGNPLVFGFHVHQPSRFVAQIQTPERIAATTLKDLDEAVPSPRWGVRLDGVASVFLVQPDGSKDLLPAVGSLHEAGGHEALSSVECSKAERTSIDIRRITAAASANENFLPAARSSLEDG